MNRKFNYKNYNILIIEDSKSINDILYSEFKYLGYNCFSALSLKKAKKIIKSNRIDYILLDLHLPDGSGYELIEKFENTDTKIFVLTAQLSKELEEKAYKKGIIDFIIKDSNFFYHIPSITKTIERIEKNKQKNILVIDDSLIIQEQLKEMFSKKNYNIKLASDGKTTYNNIVENEIHLIILDVQLKDENGIEFLKKYYTQIIVKKQIPVIIISGSVNATVMRDGLHSGAVDVLRKPLIKEEIELKVDLWIDYKRQEEEINESTKLLNQYKETVDRSFIVSKTDPNGVMTYVNDEFCKVSGYSKNELINAKHSIIRHKDMKNNYFEKMWNKIKTKKEPWIGKIKNKNKNGETYWITTVINPILDSNNEIIEFIAVSNDITEHEKVKAYFKNQLNSSMENLSQAMSLHDEYKRAMYESSIVSRTDLKGVITYANDKFAEVSGYTKKEMIGKTHRIVKHPEQNPEIYKDLWKTIKSGNTWKGVVKNRSKSGETYWVNSTIVPIKDKDKNIIE